jgi:hypothetical protein
LGAVLVGLSVAPRVLPGDTLRLRPRVVAGATVDARAPDGALAQLTVGDAVTWFAAGLTAVLPTPSLLLPSALVLVAAWQHHRRVAASRPPATGCRGPPFSA